MKLIVEAEELKRHVYYTFVVKELATKLRLRKATTITDILPVSIYIAMVI